MKKKILIILLVIFILAAGFSAYRIYTILNNYRKSTDTYEEIGVSYRSSVKQTADDREEEAEENIDYSVYETEGKLELMQVPFDYILTPLYDLDVEKLSEMNSDFRGWIIISDTNIDYPVLQSADNIEYLRRAADGTAINCGSIFIDCRTQDPFHEYNTIIYGHNQRNQRMFHDLLKYKDEEFAASHPYVEIYEADGSHHLYQVFSVYLTISDSQTYTVGFDSQEEFRTYLELMVSQSLYDFQVPVSETDTIITLSTCTNEYDENRMIVQARRMN